MSPTDEATRKATGRSMVEWATLLDREGAADLSHKEIAALLQDRHGVSAWWAQSVTVAYEKARGRRVLGQTADAGFQVGVQGTVDLSQAELWDFLMSPAGRKLWLGWTAPWSLEPGSRSESGTGGEVEIRTVKPPDRLRLAWRPAGASDAVVLQFTLSCPRNRPGRTTLGIHLEKLADAEARETMRAHWKMVLERLRQALDDD